MATTPSPVLPAAPPPAPAAPAPSPRDQIFQALTGPGPAPAPAPVTTPVVPPPELAPAPAPVAAPAPPAPPAPPAEFDAESIDFDATPKPPVEAAPAVPAPEAAPSPPLITEEEKATLSKDLSPEQQSALEAALKSEAVAKILETVSLRSERGKRQLQAFKTIRDLEAPPTADGTGGIGHAPTVDEIKAMYQSHLNWQAAQHEFEANPRSWLLNHFAPDPETKQLPAGAVQVLAQLHEVLQQNAPQLYIQTQVTPVLSDFTNRLYGWAMGFPEGSHKDEATGVDDRARALYVAGEVERLLFGKTRTVPTGPAAPGATDPLAAERAMLLQQQQQYQQAQSALQQRAVAQFDNSVGVALETNLTKDIDSLFTQAGISATRSAREQAALRTDLMNAIYDSISGNFQMGISPTDPPALQNFRIEVERARLGRLDPSVPVETFRQLARQAIRRLAPAFVKEINTGTLTSSTARHAAAAEAASRVAPAPGAGVPVPQSVLPVPAARQPNESQEDYVHRAISEAMALGQPIR